jgi:hypothetical protein
MHNHSFIAAGLGLALTMAVLAVGLKISTTPAWSASDIAQQSINRSLKGDRSAPLTARREGGIGLPGAAIIAPELLDGCESVISSIGDLPLSRVAGSCLS